MPGDPSPLPARALEQAQIFRNRLEKLARHLRRYPARGITCFRLYDHDIPDVPLVLERYEDHLHVAEYAQRHGHSPAEHQAWIALLLETAREVLGVAPEATTIKVRERQEGLSQYERVAAERQFLRVREAGLTFLVNLTDYLDTGLFLDHRLTRQMVREVATGRRFLNLFAYTGSFTVYAAAGGAASTTTVDLSNTYLDWARRNLVENALEGPQHRFVRADAVRFVREHPPGEHYDLVVVDPPTFSKSKMTEGVWDVQRHHAALLERVLGLMAPGGTIYFSTNFRKFRLEEEALRGCEIREISSRTVPPEYHDRKIHRAWRIVKAGPEATRSAPVR